MDNQIMSITLITITPPRKTASLADCTLCVVVFRTLNHFLLISRNNFEINISNTQNRLPGRTGEKWKDAMYGYTSIADDYITYWTPLNPLKFFLFGQNITFSVI